MTITSVSTAYLGNAMLPAVTQADAQLSQMEVEQTTGEYANLGEHLGESAGYELSLRSTDDLLQTLTTANALTGGSLSTASSALSSLTSSAQTALSALISWTPTATSGVDLASTGDDAMQSLVSLANSSYDDQYVFGGINSGAAPMSSFTAGSAAQTALLDAFQTQFGFLPSAASAQNITGAQMTTFLDGAYANEFSGAAWTSNWSTASSTNLSAEIAPGETAQTSANLNSGGFQQLTQAYTMLALLGNSSLSTDATQSIVTSASTLINQGLTQLTKVGEGVGQIQAQVKQADDDMSIQMTLIKTQIGGLDGVDSTALATQLNTLTTQLETAYQVTAQLQKLSLAQYLPT